MTDYYVNNRAQSNGDHEVHVSMCMYLPSSRTYLGDFTHCTPAVATARNTHPQSNGCATCCPSCHTG